MSTSPYFPHVGVINKWAVIQAIAEIRHEIEIAASLEDKSVLDVRVSGVMVLMDLVNALQLTPDESRCALGSAAQYQEPERVQM